MADLPGEDMEHFPKSHTLNSNISSTRRLGGILRMSLPEEHADLVSAYDETLRRCSSAGRTDQAAHLEELISALRRLLQAVTITSDASRQAYCLLVSCYHTRRMRK